MATKNIKKVFFTLFTTAFTFSSIVACGTQDNNSIQLQNSISALSTLEVNDYVPKHKFGARFSPDSPKVLFDELPTNSAPKKVDLRKFCSPVVNQGDLGACTGFSIAKGLREYLLIRDNKPLVSLSPLFLYYNERKMERTVNKDNGADVASGMKVLKNIGVAPESDWPYNVKKFKIEPSEIAYQDAEQFKVTYIKALKGLREIKEALNNKSPVVFGIEAYQSFEDTKDGYIPLPDKTKEKDLGGHAVACFGYDDTKHVLIVKNSWGDDWGDKGYFYLPYDFFKAKLVDSAWMAETK
jgi:C1A family cysteine protease